MAATALEEKLTAVGFKKLARPSKRWYHARAAKLTTMSWSHPQLGDFIVGIEGKSVGDVTEKEGMTFAPVHVGTKMPGQFRVTFAANLNDSVICVLQARGNNVEESFGNLPELTVKVEWDGDKPQTRRKNEDNLDHFLCTNEGVVMQLQTSFVTRHDSFYLANHELWCLQVVETTEQNPNYKTHEVNGKHYAAVNLWDSQAYPGADWLITNAQTGPKVIEAVIASGAEIAVVTELPVLDWDPPAFPQAEEGSLGAIVLWFNPNVGAKVLCENDEVRFVPPKGIRDSAGRNLLKRGVFGLVSPKQQVLLSVEMSNTPGAFNVIRPID